MLGVRFAAYTRQLSLWRGDQNLTNPTVIVVTADSLERAVWTECDRARKHHVLNGPVIASGHAPRYRQF